MVCFPFLFLSMYDSSFYFFTWLIIFSWKLDIIEHHFSNCHSRWKLSFSWTLIVKSFFSSFHRNGSIRFCTISIYPNALGFSPLSVFFTPLYELHIVILHYKTRGLLLSELQTLGMHSEKQNLSDLTPHGSVFQASRLFLHILLGHRSH